MKIRLSRVTKECNVGLQTIVEFLEKKGITVDATPNAAINEEQYEMLKKEYGADQALRDKADKERQIRQQERKNTAKEKRNAPQEIKTQIPEDMRPKVVTKGHIDLNAKPQPAPQPTPAQTEKTGAVTENPVSRPENPNAAAEKAAASPATTKGERESAIGTVDDGVFKLNSSPTLTGPKVLGTIDLSTINSNTRPKKKSKEERRKEREEKGRQNGTAASTTEGKKKRARISNKERVDLNNPGVNEHGGQQRRNSGTNNSQNGNGSKRSNKERNRKAQSLRPEISDEDVAKQVKETLARLTGKSKASKGAKYRKEKREQVRAQQEEQFMEEQAESKVLKITEFVTANELATMMDVPVTKVIGTCMSIGIMVSINQRLDAETIELVADEFGFKTEFISAEVSEAVAEEEDNEEDLEPRAPIVTVMGHVDHGKTSLLDYIRKSNVIAGEAGGITQHIGAYNVTLENGRHITFLDTPGHEAFTAMRARGAQVTDIAIIIIAADDDIMPQTKEAINHAMAANVPIVFAINKIDKPGANPDKIKEGLAAMNYLVEEWGGKYQSQDISAKKGIGVADLLDKVLLEADMLELKANPNRKATGTIIESSLDKGRGYVATVLVSNGTLHQGDIVLAGTNYGRVKALFNERNQRVNDIGPSMAATLLGFNGAPQAGDTFHVMETEQEAREIANKREQLHRETK